MADLCSARTTEDLRRAVKAAVRVVPDFPSPGVNFRDISATWEQQPQLFRMLVDEIARPFREPRPDVVLSIEALGHLFGPTSPTSCNVGLCWRARPVSWPAAHFASRTQ